VGVSQSLSKLSQYCGQKTIAYLEQLELPSFECRRLVVALSGGMDSTALLSLLCEAAPKLFPHCGVVALHINHGLSSAAGDWQEHCRNLCADLNAEFVVKRISVEKQSGGLEEAARLARYQAFSEFLEPGDCLLLGHHVNDQAETLLLRLMRGSGPKGLSAMAQARMLGDNPLIRPLLEIEPQKLQQYLISRKTTWVEDDSNVDEGFDRNFLRHQVMPLLESRWPGFSQRWSQSADHCRQADSQLDDLAIFQLQSCDVKNEKLGCSLSLNALLELAGPSQDQLLRYWFGDQGYNMPSMKLLGELRRQLFKPNRADHQSMVRAGDCCMAVFDDRLFLMPVLAVVAQPLRTDLMWDSRAPLQLDGGWVLTASELPVDSLTGTAPTKVESGLLVWLPWLVTMKARKPGLRARPIGRRHSQSFKKLLQENNIAPWLRPLIPLIYDEDQLLAVGDYWRESGASADTSQDAANQGRWVSLVWAYRP